MRTSLRHARRSESTFPNEPRSEERETMGDVSRHVRVSRTDENGKVYVARWRQSIGNVYNLCSWRLVEGELDEVAALDILRALIHVREVAAIKTRACAGAAYARLGPRTRTHAVNTLTGSPLCRVKRESIIDDECATDENAPPTCPTCNRKDPRHHE
jgi:hypothetical protein